ncbi:hypothetical protein HNV12_13855 [Methanococcoides sp. SA1]|nr:hypothetical protein [Methanococcoides sp. SA1]
MATEQIILYCLAAIVGFFILKFYYRGKKGLKMKEERLTREYRQALNGTNRQIALATGREFYKFFRSDGMLTIYDEQAIDNDMKMMPQEKVHVEVNNSNNVVDQLERLAKLKEQGILTDTEFYNQKDKILSE